MSLRFIIDGYNLINHPSFTRYAPKSGLPQEALVSLIKRKRLCGSPNNPALLVFDGYPPSGLRSIESAPVRMVFSRDLSADEYIMRLVEKDPSAGSCVVVSDDKQIIIFARASRAKTLSVEEFIEPGEKQSAGKKKQPEAEISYSDKEKINRELRKLWIDK